MYLRILDVPVFSVSYFIGKGKCLYKLDSLGAIYGKRHSTELVYRGIASQDNSFYIYIYVR